MAPSFILTYHSIDRSRSVISVTPEEFRAHMDVLAAGGRAVVPLSDLSQRPGSVAITFDDGFHNFYEHAFPVLAERGLPATVFAVSGHCGANNDWASQAAGAVPILPLMEWHELQEIAGYGVTIGAHTVTHARLTELPPENLRRELNESRRTLENRLGRTVDTFAYPYGCLNAEVRGAVASEFCLGCGTELNFVGGNSDPFVLPRLDMYYLRRPEVFRLLLQGRAGAMYIGLRRRIRNLRRLTIA